MITEKGYFKNIPEGSAQYADRMKKAKEKFLSKASVRLHTRHNRRKKTTQKRY